MTEKTAAQHGAQAHEPGQDTTLRDFIDIFVRRRWLLLVVWAVVIAVGMAYTMTRKRVYEASAMLVVATKEQSAATNNPIMAQLGALTASRNVATQVEVVSSPDNLTQAFSQLTPAERVRGFGYLQRPGAGLLPPLWSYRVDNKLDTDVITVTASSYDPDLAARFANLIAATYLNRDLNNNNATNRNARIFLEKQLQDTAKRLAAATGYLAGLKKRTTLVSPDGQLLAATERLYGIKSALDVAQAGLDASTKRLAALDQILHQTKQDVSFSTVVQQNPVYALVSARISNLEGQRAQLLQQYMPDSVQVRAVDQTIQLEQENLKKTVENSLLASVKELNPALPLLAVSWATEQANKIGLAAQVVATNKILAASQAELLTFPTMARDLDAATRSVTVLDATYTQLSSQYYTFLVNEKSNVPGGLISSFARKSFLPVYPNVTISAILLVLMGLILAVCAAVTAERLDVRIRDPLTIERLTGLTTLTVVPDITLSGSGRPMIGEDIDNMHAFLESCRILRNNIAFSSPDKPVHILAVTSAGRGEGKTTVTSNLGIAIGMDGRRVLLIEGDLRRPSLHKAFDVPADVGFTSLVTGQVNLNGAILPTKYEGVFCLPSGPLPPNPTEFLNSAQSRKVIEEAGKLYDMVIIDCPPSAGLSDIQVLSTCVDGVVLVVALDRTMRPQLQATMRTLWQANASMCGTAINRALMRRPGYGHYGYAYNYYNYYYQYDESTPEEGRERRARRRKK